jgi:5-methyltetrahydrofolate--homocysteine methyltransferase
MPKSVHFRHSGNQKEYLTLEKARENKFQIDWNNTPIYKPNFIGVKQLIDFPLEILREYIDWTFFFITWGLKGHYPQIFDDGEQGEEAKKLYAEANEFLDEIIEKKMLQANAVFGIWPANADGDDVILYENETRQKEIGRFYHIRQQEKKKEGLSNFCLSDFVALLESEKLITAEDLPLPEESGSKNGKTSSVQNTTITRQLCLKRWPTG